MLTKSSKPSSVPTSSYLSKPASTFTLNFTFNWGFEGQLSALKTSFEGGGAVKTLNESDGNIPTISVVYLQKSAETKTSGSKI